MEADKDFVSFGKRLHNELTYRGVDWLLNTAVAVSFAYWSARTKTGQEYFTKPVTGFFKSALKPLFKNETSLQSGAEWGTRFISIMAGGTAIIPLVQHLENKENKKKFIRWADERYYGKDAVANDPKFAASYQAIDDEPHKSFGIGMAARLAVLAPLIAMTVTPAVNNPLRQHIYEPIGKGSKWLSGKLGIKPSAGMADPLKGAEIVENGVKKMQSNWDFLHETIGFDLGLTFLYSFMHEYAYKGLAKMGMKETDDDHERGQQFKTIDGPLTPSSADGALHRIKPAVKPEAAQEKSFTSKIQPKSPVKATPSELHASRIAAQERHEDANSLGHSLA